MYTKQGDGMNGSPPNHNAMYLQRQLLVLNPGAASDTGHPLTVDGQYGGNTAHWTSVLLTGGYGNEVNGDWFARLDQMVAQKLLANAGSGQGPVGPQGPAGPMGPKGDKGDKGDAAILTPGTFLEVVEE